MLGDVANLGTIALLVALAAVNAALSVAVLRWHSDGDERDANVAVDAGPDVATDAATVRCAKCGTLNERVYTFCGPAWHGSPAVPARPARARRCPRQDDDAGSY
ncbi:hypothetical protein BRC72_03635 [Halobacteriales archaeon QH_7_66_36]|nr:MAG: hypothetical protein BRC72_03635 [Halobacteriales archaeon QH_7_66_36]